MRDFNKIAEERAKDLDRQRKQMQKFVKDNQDAFIDVENMLIQEFGTSYFMPPYGMHELIIARKKKLLKDKYNLDWDEIKY